MGLNYQARPSMSAIKYVCLHTNEGPHTQPHGTDTADYSAEGLATFLTRTAYTNNPVSYHVLVDDDSIVRYLPDNAEAWCAFGANPIGLHLCLTGYAAQQRNEWLTTHAFQLRLAATVVRDWCKTYNIPITKLIPLDVVHNRPGIIGHIDWTIAKVQGTHTDPGTTFPWDYFIGLVNMQVSTPEPTGKKDNMIENFEVGSTTAKTIKLLGCPVGRASQIINRAWISSQILGPSNGTVRYWFQNDTGGLDDSKSDLPIRWSDGHSQRIGASVPDGTTQIRIEYNFPNGGTITLEVEPK